MFRKIVLATAVTMGVIGLLLYFVAPTALVDLMLIASYLSFLYLVFSIYQINSWNSTQRTFVAVLFAILAGFIPLIELCVISSNMNVRPLREAANFAHENHYGIFTQLKYEGEIVFSTVLPVIIMWVGYLFKKPADEDKIWWLDFPD